MRETIRTAGLLGVFGSRVSKQIATASAILHAGASHKRTCFLWVLHTSQEGDRRTRGTCACHWNDQAMLRARLWSSRGLLTAGPASTTHLAQRAKGVTRYTIYTQYPQGHFSGAPTLEFSNIVTTSTSVCSPVHWRLSRKAGCSRRKAVVAGGRLVLVGMAGPGNNPVQVFRT
jgi:hypothetical protein